MYKHFMAHLQRDDSYVTILTIVIIMVMAVTLTVTVISVLTNNTMSYGTTIASDISRYNADSCAEVAINRLKENLAYTGGNDTLTLDKGTCTVVNITGGGNNNRMIYITGTYNSAVRKLIVTISSVNPSTIISSWTEVDEL